MSRSFPFIRRRGFALQFRIAVPGDLRGVLTVKSQAARATVRAQAAQALRLGQIPSGEAGPL